MSNINTIKSRIIFKSASSGLWYQNKDAAGDISAVRVDGVLFEQTNDGIDKEAYNRVVMDIVNFMSGMDVDAEIIKEQFLSI